MGVVTHQPCRSSFGYVHLCGDLRHRFVLCIVEPLGQPHPRHFVLAQGHDAQVRLQIAIHPSTQEGVEPGGQLTLILVITVGLYPLPQLQTPLSAQILQQRRCGSVRTPKFSGRIQGDGSDKVLQLFVELVKGTGVTVPNLLIQFLVCQKPPPPFFL